MTEQLHFHFLFSYIGEGNGNPLQYSCLESPRDLKNILHWNLVKSALDKEDRRVPVYSPFFNLFVVSVCDVLV